MNADPQYLEGRIKALQKALDDTAEQIGALKVENRALKAELGRVRANGRLQNELLSGAAFETLRENEHFRKVLDALLPYVLKDYYSNYARPGYKAAVEAAKDALLKS